MVLTMANPPLLHLECSRERHWEPKMDHLMVPTTEPAKVDCFEPLKDHLLATTMDPLMAMMAASTDGFAMASLSQLHSECSRPKMDHPMVPTTEPAKVDCFEPLKDHLLATTMDP